VVRFLIASLLIGALLCGCGSQSSRPLKTEGIVRCGSATLRVSPNGGFAAGTGATATTYVITNISKQPCKLKGFPRVRWYLANGRLAPFIYHRGFRGRTLGGAASMPVVLRSGNAARFFLLFYRCDLGSLGVARELHIMLPGSTEGPIRLRASSNVCRPAHGRPQSDPGNEIQISPVVPDRRNGFPVGWS
jgi:Protein of unknown function (DUF4232)